MRLRSLLAAGVLLAVALVSGCGGPVVTQARLDDAVGTAFAKLYVEHQRLLGHPPVTNAQASATCTRNDSTAGTSGAGDDWVCQLVLQIGTPVQAITYEVNARADGCYSADGPPGIVGGRTLRAADGHHRVNPLFAFDGCFDPA